MRKVSAPGLGDARDDAVRVVKEFENEATIVRAARAQAPAIKRSVDKKPGIPEVTTDPLLPAPMAAAISPTNRAKMPSSGEIKNTELVEEIPIVRAIQDPPAA